MFRIARCQDLIDLRGRYRDRWLAWEDVALLRLKYPDFRWFEELRWGLKQMGTLLCVDHLERHRPATSLEIGAGFNTFFDRHYGDRLELWTIDDAGFYPGDVLAAANAARGRTRFVDGLMGARSGSLPTDWFDVVFSISVIEHIPETEVERACREMFRVTRAGGWAVHSLDVTPRRAERLGRLWHAALRGAGFVIDEEPNLRWRLKAPAAEQPLFEPLSISYPFYGGYREDLWTNPKTVANHLAGTILIAARKPGGA